MLHYMGSFFIRGCIVMHCLTPYPYVLMDLTTRNATVRHAICFVSDWHNSDHHYNRDATKGENNYTRQAIRGGNKQWELHCSRATYLLKHGRMQGKTSS